MFFWVHFLWHQGDELKQLHPKAGIHRLLNLVGVSASCGWLWNDWKTIELDSRNVQLAVFCQMAFCRIYMNCTLPQWFFQVTVFFGNNERLLKFSGKLSWLEASIFSNGFTPNWCFKMDSFDEKELMISWMHLSFLNFPFHRLCEWCFTPSFSGKHWRIMAPGSPEILSCFGIQKTPRTVSLPQFW